MAFLLNYTREPIDEVIYDPRLAYSMHLAISDAPDGFQALNHNSGVLFAKATENEDGSLNPKCIKNPYIFQLKDGIYGIAAVRTGGDGEDDEESKGSILVFTTKDFLEYQELGLMPLDKEYIESIYCAYSKEKDSCRIIWKNRANQWYSVTAGDITCLKADSAPVEASPIEVPKVITDIEGAVPQNVIEISAQTAERLKKKLLTPVNVGISFSAQAEASNAEELKQYKAVAEYSDGTKAEKSVDWDLSSVDFAKKGTYQIKGQVHQEHFGFPVAFNRADPCVTRWNGKYYFIATNDADNNHTLYIREADTLSQLTEAEEILLLDSQTYEGIGGLLWAPEFHEINGRLYIFHAATPGEFFCEESHVMALREGGNPANRADWSAPKRVVKKDGSDICEMGKEITLDMTCFEWEGDYYVVWSQRQFLPKDLGAWLYIAKLNPDEPWKLLTEPVILSKPDYGWANNHTFVDEGPFALMRGNTLYLTFSSAAVDTSYVVGLLSIEKGMDLLKRENWKKNNYPILTSRSVEGEFGTGHNAYVIDEDGTVWNTYHARPGVKGVRSSGIRRVHFDIDGAPVLDLTEELDVAPSFKNLETTLIVK